MKLVLPTLAVQAAIQRLNALVQQEYGTSAYASVGTGNMGAIVVGNPNEILALMNQMQQLPLPVAAAAVMPIKTLRPVARKALRPVARYLVAH